MKRRIPIVLALLALVVPSTAAAARVGDGTYSIDGGDYVSVPETATSFTLP